jgi:hypothetical protein
MAWGPDRTGVGLSLSVSWFKKWVIQVLFASCGHAELLLVAAEANNVTNTVIFDI